VGLTTTGEQWPILDTSATTSLRLFGLDLVTAAAGGSLLYAADTRVGQLVTLSSASTPAATAPAGAVTFGGAFGAPWGVTGFASGSPAVDQYFAAAGSEVWRQAGTAGTPVRIAQGGLLSGARKLLATAFCPTPKLLVAARDTGAILVLDGACTATDCANGTGQRTLLVGLGNPSGLAWMPGASATAASLLITDETLNAVYRLDGNFCSL
jgi:hypothetical protein